LGPRGDDRAVGELSERFGLVNPTAAVVICPSACSSVEILKLLYRRPAADSDEPSAFLTPQEVEDLFAVLQRLIEEGRTAIFITHKLREVIAVCHRATVLRRGEVVGTVKVSDTQPETIAHMMVGHDLTTVQRQPVVLPAGRQAALSVHELHVADDRGLLAVRGVSFAVHAGEIVGLAGVEGNGQRELIEALVGLRMASQGEIMLNGKPFTHARNRRRRAAGMALIPEDRARQGLSLPSTLAENLTSTRPHGSTVALGCACAGSGAAPARRAIRSSTARGLNARRRSPEATRRKSSSRANWPNHPPS
jgi:simple sugar transport system ATP-binding protein